MSIACSKINKTWRNRGRVYTWRNRGRGEIGVGEIGRNRGRVYTLHKNRYFSITTPAAVNVYG